MDELDSYSRTVSAVAAEITGKVAAVRIGRGSGSAVVTGEGVLVTNAHVVGEARAGRADFADGTQTEFVVAGTDPLSDLAVLRAVRPGDLPEPVELSDAAPEPGADPEPQPVALELAETDDPQPQPVNAPVIEPVAPQRHANGYDPLSGWPGSRTLMVD